MRRSEFILALIAVPVDYLMLLLAAVSAYFLRFSDFSKAIRPVIFNLPFDEYLHIAFLFSLLWILIFALSGLYRSARPSGLTREIFKIVSACSLGFLLIAVYIFFGRELFNSRFIVLGAWLFATVYVIIARSFLRWLQKTLYRFGVGVHKVILVGYGPTADNLLKEFFSRKTSGFEVVKRVRDFSLDTAHELEAFLNIDTKLKSISQRPADEIIQADPNLSKAETLRLFDFANEQHLDFKYVADLLGVKVLRTEVLDIAGIPLVEVKRTTLEGWGMIWKRIFDIFISGLLIIILSPVLLIIALLIKLDSRGPVFFSTRDNGDDVYRVGQKGLPFKYFKFRSMIVNSDSLRYNELADKNIRTDGPLVKIKDDPRVTRFGRFIRRWSLDELPELFLVFSGRMSLVGPRPHLPEEVARYEQHQRKTLTIKPGITGLAQVSGRSDLSFEEEVKLDIYYIENWSPLLDITILLKTPLAVVRHRQAE